MKKIKVKSNCTTNVETIYEPTNYFYIFFMLILHIGVFELSGLT